MKKIKDLIKNCNIDVDIKGITDNSTHVKPGYLFVATKGFHVDHYDYVDDAIHRGCSFVICDREISYDIPYIVVDHINEYYHELCQNFYDICLDDFHFIGITGTDGKTSTATMVSQLIPNCAYIGTNGVSVHGREYSTHNTTPCVEELYESLQKIQKENVSTVVMEVSSEALLHDRVSPFLFDIVAFTNITGDHLNVHKTFENYFKTKLKLMDLLKEDGICLMNQDDEYLSQVKGEHIYTYGFQSSDFQIKSCHYHKEQTVFEVLFKENTYSIKSPFLGTYNVYNVCLSFAIAISYGVQPSLIQKKIPSLLPIKGRGESLHFGQPYTIILDYAHTIHGIQSVLNTYSHYETIICVTGAAGGREHEKRKKIGDIIFEFVDIPIFTMDDPREEDPNTIIDEMVTNHKDYVRIIDRKEAIEYALSIASKGSVVLILGKGRDSYMAIGKEKIPYCDYDVIQNYFTSKKQ